MFQAILKASGLVSLVSLTVLESMWRSPVEAAMAGFLTVVAVLSDTV